MTGKLSPELIDIIKKREEEKHQEVRIPLHLPEPAHHQEERQEEEPKSRVIIIDLVD